MLRARGTPRGANRGRDASHLAQHGVARRVTKKTRLQVAIQLFLAQSSRRADCDHRPRDADDGDLRRPFSRAPLSNVCP